MIDQKEGETELSVKIHYDDMVSVTITWILLKESGCHKFLSEILVALCGLDQIRISLFQLAALLNAHSCLSYPNYM
jgi:hypothetical protein